MASFAWVMVAALSARNADFLACSNCDTAAVQTVPLAAASVSAASAPASAVFASLLSVGAGAGGGTGRTAWVTTTGGAGSSHAQPDNNTIDSTRPARAGMQQIVKTLSFIKGLHQIFRLKSQKTG
jgi:hypothetical protein